MDILINLLVLIGLMLPGVAEPGPWMAQSGAPMVASVPGNPAWPSITGEAWPDMSGHATDQITPFRGLEFDGDDYIITSAFTPGGESGAKLSVFAWVKMTTGAIAAQSLPGSMCFTVHATGVGTGCRMFTSTNGSSFDNINFTTQWNDDAWRHVGFVWDSGSLKLYVDGVEDVDVTLGYTTLYQPSIPLYVGAERSGVRYANGIITQYHQFAVALTPAQVTTLKDGTADDGAQVMYPMLVADGDADNQTVTDNSGNGHDAQRGNDAGEDSADPEWTGPYKRITSGGPQ